MVTQGTRTPNLPLKTVADEFLCNTNSGSGMETVRVSADAVRAQIAIGSGVAFATWAALNATTGTSAGQRAEVHGDAGTHTDPVVGGTKANSGVYGWSASPAGWQWLSATDFVDQAGSALPLMNGAAAAGSSTDYSREDHVHPTDTSRAPLESPALTGNPTAPTPAAGDNGTRIATTAFIAAANTPIIRGEVNNRFRPGEAPYLFSAQKDGRAEDMSPLSPSGSVVNADGASYRVTAAATVVSREAIWVPPGRTWRCRTNYRRATNPSDPINDAVRTSVVWLDKDYAFLSTQVIVTDAACTTANGRRSQSFDLPSPPANGVFARLMVETFGGDGVTDIELLAFLDITDAPVVQRLYQGLWDANANSPALASGVGTQGHYYIVKTAGTTLIDGVSSWAVGDWIIFNGSAWEKLLNADGDTLVTIAGSDGITSSQSGNDFTVGINMTNAMDQWLDSLPTDPAALGSGEWWNNGGIPTRTV